VANREKLGWIGTGRMGFPMAERLAKAGADLSVWNRTPAKAEPLKSSGAKIVTRPSDLAGHDILFTMVSTGADLEDVIFGAGGVASADEKLPRIIVDWSSIGMDESAAQRQGGEGGKARLRRLRPCRHLRCGEALP
jgi:3-hydroxyisobutyrate dehydrogenase